MFWWSGLQSRNMRPRAREPIYSRAYKRDLIRQAQNETHVKKIFALVYSPGISSTLNKNSIFNPISHSCALKLVDYKVFILFTEKKFPIKMIHKKVFPTKKKNKNIDFSNMKFVGFYSETSHVCFLYVYGRFSKWDIFTDTYQSEILIYSTIQIQYMKIFTTKLEALQSNFNFTWCDFNVSQ